jgi:hypothetical protein
MKGDVALRGQQWAHAELIARPCDVKTYKATFFTLPLELRNEVYNYAFVVVKAPAVRLPPQTAREAYFWPRKKEVPKGRSSMELQEKFPVYTSRMGNDGVYCSGTIRYLVRRLPPHFFINRQILEEVTVLHFAEISITIAPAGYSNAITFFDSFPNVAAWQNIRHLEFTGSQKNYANEANSEFDVRSDFTVHNIAICCPRLQKLAFTLLPYLLKTPPEFGCPVAMRRAYTPAEFEERTKLSRVFENPCLKHLCIGVAVDPWQYRHIRTNWEVLFEECTVELEFKAICEARSLKVERKVVLPEERNHEPQPRYPYYYTTPIRKSRAY